MYFTVEEENLICLYHNTDRRRTAANLRAALPDMDREMAALACQTADKLDTIHAIRDKVRFSSISFLKIVLHSFAQNNDLVRIFRSIFFALVDKLRTKS